MHALVAQVIEGDLGRWILSLGLEGEELEDLVVRFIKPGIAVKTLRSLFALDPEDIDEVLEGLPLATRRVVKKAYLAEQ